MQVSRESGGMSPPSHPSPKEILKNRSSEIKSGAKLSDFQCKN